MIDNQQSYLNFAITSKHNYGTRISNFLFLKINKQNFMSTDKFKTRKIIQVVLLAKSA